MRQLVLVSHGSLAEGMQSAMKMILNRSDGTSAFGLDRYKDPEEVLRLVRELVDQNPEDQFAVLCDIKGGSVHSQMVQLLGRPNVFLYTGMNLSMALELATAEEFTQEAAEEVLDLARKNITCIGPQTVLAELQKEEEGTFW